MRDVEKSPLKRVALLNMGQSPPSEDYNQAGLGLPFLQGNADFGARYPLATTFCKTPKKICQTGDLLVSVRAPVGALNSADQPYGIGRGLCAITSIPGRLDQTFLLWALEGTRSELHAVSTGSTYDAVDLDDLGSLRIPLPPLPTQRAIADFLDRKTAALDGLIARKERLLELLAERRAALIHRAVTRGLDPDVPLKDSGVPWIGEIPAHWEVVSVRRLLASVTSGPRDWSERIVEDGHSPCFVQSGNMDDHFRLDLSACKRIPGQVAQQAPRTRIGVGDVLICITGARTGRVALAEAPLPDAYVNQHLALLKTRKGVQPRYLAFVLGGSVGQGQLTGAQYGGTKQGLSLDAVRDVLIPLPPVHEQVKIEEAMAASSRSSRVALESLRLSSSRLREYRQALITAAVTGQLEIPEVPA